MTENNRIVEIQKQLHELLIELIRQVRPDDSSVISDKTLRDEGLQIVSVSDFKEEYLSILDQRNKAKRKGDYITTGFVQLDEVIGGFFKGELIIIGGRPGSGKTSLLLSFILNQLANKIPVALCSLELTREAILDRLVTMKKKIPVTQLKTGVLTQKEYQKIEKCISDLTDPDLYMMESPFLDSVNIADRLDHLVNIRGVKALYVDYLQLMILRQRRRNREQEVSELMRELKSLAVEFKIPVIIASQMNRNVEWRGGAKRPLLSDLRESGTIEEIADKVLMVYRPEMFGINMDEEGNSLKGRAEVIVAKNRVGATGEIMLSFNEKYGLFENINWDKNIFPSLNLPDNPFYEPPF